MLLELFYLPNCPSCSEAGLLWEKLKASRNRNGRRLRMIKRNMCRSRARARRLGIFASPTFALNGKILAIGVPSIEKITAKFYEAGGLDPGR